MQTHFYKSILLSAVAAVLLNGCGGGAGFGQPDNAPVPISTLFTVGGSVTGLSSTGLTLQNNGADNLTPSANGSFTFATSVASGGSYAVTILTQPGGQTCAVTQGAGTNIAGNITNVAVSCSALSTYSISGSVAGLNAGEHIEIQNNGADSITIASNTAFAFATPVSYGSSYAVTVHNQPVGQSCVVTNGATAHLSANVNNVAINCGPATYTVLYLYGTNSATDAVAPTNANVIEGSDGNFYGTTNVGGSDNAGAIFKITPAGDESILYSFSSVGTAPNSPTNAGLTVGSDGNFYGTTTLGGTDLCGTVYKITPAGVLTVIYEFQLATTDGCAPYAGLILGIDGNFYGTTIGGGTHGTGTVFKVTPSGTESLVYSFANSGDPNQPVANLVQASDGNLYGTAVHGAAHGYGGVFKVTLAGVETILHSFSSGGSDGIYPRSGLIIGSDGNLYGNTIQGGTNNDGVIFKMTLTGTETILHNFVGGTADGANPEGATLIQGSDGYFYGSTKAGGTSNNGVLFRMASDGSMTILHSFAGGTTDGALPWTGLTIGTDGYVYGMTSSGGLPVSGTYPLGQGVFFRY